MKETQLIMGMPIMVEVLDGDMQQAIADTFAYFREVDERFSTYKDTSEISRINRGEIDESHYSDEMHKVFAIAQQTKEQTHDYFDIKRPDGRIDPSGVVKGWAIHQAAQRLREAGHEHFLIDAGGDVAVSGKNERAEEWSIGIRNPFDREQIVKVVRPRGAGVATSGTSARGKHIYDPHTGEPPAGLVSITVIAPDILQADLYATAAFAMGADGIGFIEALPQCEGYAINEHGIATMTTGFAVYTV